MPASCSVIDCEQKYSHGNDVSYHKFPVHNPEVVKEWIQFTGRGMQWKPTKWSSICSRHFSSQDYKTFGILRRLIHTAVPTIRNAPSKIEQIFEEEDEENSLIEEEYPSDFIRHLVKTCRLCANNRNDTIVDCRAYMNLIGKCLSFVNLESLSNGSYSPTKICLCCVNQLCSYSAFIDKISRGQQDLEAILSAIKTNPNETEIPIQSTQVVVNIKQEPREALAKIKEENLDMSARPKESHYTRPELRKVYLKKPSLIQENKKFILINTSDMMHKTTPTKFNKESKNCEILEIINLYPPIVDITSTTIKEVQPYCEASTIPVIQPIMKIENTMEEEEIYEDFGVDQQPQRYEEQVNLLDLIEYEHKYSLRPDFEQLPVEETIDLKSFDCRNCGKDFSTEAKLEKHSKFLCQKTKNIYKCGYCVKKFKSLITCLAHKRLCVKRKRKLATRFLVKGDKQKKPKSNLCQPRKVRIPEDYYCDKCETKYKAESAIRKHLKHHKSPEHWNKNCSFCSKKFDRDYFLIKHIVQKHDPNYEKNVKPSVLQCSRCSKLFKNSFNLKLHMLTHNAAKNYICEFCGKRFKGPTSLNQHRKNHDDTIRYVCEYENCGRFFKRRFGLQIHEKSVHLKIKNFICEICKRPFALKNDMKRCKHSLLNN